MVVGDLQSLWPYAVEINARRVLVKPYAFRADPGWHRDYPVVRQLLSQIPSAVQDDGTFPWPDWYEVFALMPDGTEQKVPKERYAAPNPATREEAEEFVNDRWERAGGDPKSISALMGAFRSNPNLPLDEQAQQYIDRSPWVWRSDIDDEALL